MSNFTFLKTDWPELYETAREAEQNVNSAPRTGFDSAQPPMNDRRLLERVVKWLYASDTCLKQPYADNLTALIHGLRLRSAPVCCPVPERSRRGLFPKILTIQKIGNLAASLPPIFHLHISTTNKILTT